MSRSELFGIANETMNEFYDRNSKVTSEILSKTEGDILIVGHASNLDTCTRLIIGKDYRKEAKGVIQMLITIPYLAAIAMEQTGESSFQLIEAPCLMLTHKSCSKFDWRKVREN